MLAVILVHIIVIVLVIVVVATLVVSEAVFALIEQIVLYKLMLHDIV